MIVTGFVAMREALDISTGNTIATIIVGIIAEFVVIRWSAWSSGRLASAPRR